MHRRLVSYDHREILWKAAIIGLLIGVLIGYGILMITGSAEGAIAIGVAVGLFTFFHIYILAAVPG